MLSHYLVGLVSYCSNASGTKWYVDDSPHLVKNIFEHLFNYEPLLLLFSFLHVLKVKQVKIFHSFCDLTSFPKVGSKIYFLRTGKMGENSQSFTGVAKPCWDQTVGSVIKTSYIFFFLIAIHSDFNEDLKK